MFHLCVPRFSTAAERPKGTSGEFYRRQIREKMGAGTGRVPKMGTAIFSGCFCVRQERATEASGRPWHRARSTKFAKHVPEMDMLTNQASHAAPVNCPPDAPSHSQPFALIRALWPPSLPRRRRSSLPPTRNRVLLLPRIFAWPHRRLRRRPLRLRWPTYRLRTRPRARCTPCRL